MLLEPFLFQIWIAVGGADTRGWALARPTLFLGLAEACVLSSQSYLSKIFVFLKKIKKIQYC